MVKARKDKLIKIGYWYSDSEPDLPMPDVGFDPVNPVVIEYLENGDVLDRWKGFSTCRICKGRPNGSKCLTDGTYQWPEGLAHYVREHNTPLPQEFIKHIGNEHFNVKPFPDEWTSHIEEMFEQTLKQNPDKQKH